MLSSSTAHSVHRPSAAPRSVHRPSVSSINRVPDPSARGVLDTYTLAIFRDTWRYVALRGDMWRCVAIRRDSAPKAPHRHAPRAPELLDAREGTMDWGGDEDDGFEEIRPTIDQSDAFEPPFELDTDEHATWVRNAIAEFE